MLETFGGRCYKNGMAHPVHTESIEGCRTVKMSVKRQTSDHGRAVIEITRVVIVKNETFLESLGDPEMAYFSKSRFLDCFEITFLKFFGI